MSAFRKCAIVLAKLAVPVVIAGFVFYKSHEENLPTPEKVIASAFDTCLREKDPDFFQDEKYFLEKTTAETPPFVVIRNKNHGVIAVYDVAHEAVQILSHPTQTMASTFMGKDLTPNEASRLQLMRSCAKSVGYTDLNHE